MLPHENGKQMIVDPTIPPEKLHFGKLPLRFYEKIGTVTARKYIHEPIKCDCYEITFIDDNGKEKRYWFKENEIT